MKQEIMTAKKAIDVLTHNSCYECAYGCEQGAARCEAEPCIVNDATTLAIDALKQWIDRRKVGIHGDLIDKDEILISVNDIKNRSAELTAIEAIYEILGAVESAEVKLRKNKTECLN